MPDEQRGDSEMHALLRCLLDHERQAASIPHIVVCRAGDQRGERYFGPFRDREAAELAAGRLECADRHSTRLHQPVPLLEPETPA